MRSFVYTLLFVSIAKAAQAQASAPVPIDWSDEDSSRVAFLLANGRSYGSGSVIVWAPADSLDQAWLEGFSDSLAQERAAAAFPFWLSEGLPDYLAQTTSAATGFREGDVFEIGGLAKVDSVCAARLSASSRRAEIRERVGRPGRLEALFTTDRAEVAPVYYACSQSFTKHVVARLGLPAVIALFPRIPKGTWRTALEAAAGEPLENVRRDWLKDLGLTPAPND